MALWPSPVQTVGDLARAHGRPGARPIRVDTGEGIAGPRSRSLVVASSDDLLGRAIVRGLLDLGWPDVRVLSDDPPMAGRPRSADVVVVGEARADSGGAARAVRPAGRVIMVGGLGALEAMAALAARVDRGAVVDSRACLPQVLSRVDGLLRGHLSMDDGVALRAHLRDRIGETMRFAELTEREQEILADLMLGRSVSAIAEARHLSPTTVRSHVRGVLSKLDMPSQLAAVALARRSCRDPGVRRAVEAAERL